MNTNLITNLDTCIPSALSMLNGSFNLLYYSHVPVIIISVFLGFFVFLKGGGKILSKVFFSLSLVFALWSILDLFTWLSTDTRVIMFAWSLTGVIEVLFFVLSLYFVYVFIEKRDISLKSKILWAIILLPLIIAISTKFNLSAFNAPECYSLEDNYSLYYKYIVEIFSFITLIIFSVVRIKKVDKAFRKQIELLLVGVVLFLFSFFSSVFLAGYFVDQGIMTGYGFEIYGLFGTIIFMAALVFLIVRFKAFDIKLLGAQALVWASIILIGSQFFFIQTNVNRVLTAITLVISSIVGIMIVRGLKKEIAQKEYIQLLANNLETSNQKLEKFNMTLETANDKLKELDAMKSQFVSLATHQIRGPLSAIKGYISLILEGDYGKVPVGFVEPLDTIFKSIDSLSHMVTDFLDVSRIDLGQMKYDFTVFDLRDLVAEVAKELRLNVEAKGLEFRTKITESKCLIKADRVKLKQVINNLIDNSSKYTKHGWLEVSIEKKGEHVLFAVKDSGVGISAETMPQLFQRFSRAKDANQTNILGTGLGLYLAKKMVEANSGRIWAESEGKEKGAQFYLELKPASEK